MADILTSPPSPSPSAPSSPSPPPPPFMDQQYIVSDNQVLDSLYINLLWGILCLFGFVVLRGWLRGPGGVFQRRQELQDLFMRPPRLVLGTIRQAWNWVMPLLAVSDADIIRCSGYDGLIITRVLLIGLQMFTFMTVLGMVVLIPVYTTNGGLKQSQVVAGSLARMSLANVTSGSNIFVLPFLMIYVFIAYSCWVLWINCKCYAQLRNAYFMCLDAMPTEAVMHQAGIAEELQARVMAMAKAQKQGQGQGQPRGQEGRSRRPQWREASAAVADATSMGAGAGAGTGAGTGAGAGAIARGGAAGGRTPGVAGLDAEAIATDASTAMAEAGPAAAHLPRGGVAPLAVGAEAAAASALTGLGSVTTPAPTSPLPAADPLGATATPTASLGPHSPGTAAAAAAAAAAPPAFVEMQPLVARESQQRVGVPLPGQEPGPGPGPGLGAVEAAWEARGLASPRLGKEAEAISAAPQRPAAAGPPGPVAEAVEDSPLGAKADAVQSAASSADVCEADWRVPEMQLRSTWLNLANFANPTLRMMLDYLDWMHPLQRIAATFGARRMRLPCLNQDEVPVNVRQYGSKDDMISYDNIANMEVRGVGGGIGADGESHVPSNRADDLAGVGDAPVADDDPLPAVLPYWRPLAMLKYLRRRYKRRAGPDEPLYDMRPDPARQRLPTSSAAAVATTPDCQPWREREDTDTTRWRSASVSAAAAACRPEMYELCYRPKSGSTAAAAAVHEPEKAAAAPPPPVWGDTPLPSRIADPLQPLLPGKRNARLLQLLKVPVSLRGAKVVVDNGGGGGRDAAAGGAGADAAGGAGADAAGGAGADAGADDAYGDDDDVGDSIIRVVNVRHYVVLIKAVHVKRGPDWLDRMAAMTYMFITTVRKGTMVTARTATDYASAAIHQVRRGYERTGLRPSAPSRSSPSAPRMSASRSPAAVRNANGHNAAAAAASRLDPTVRRYFDMFSEKMETHLVAPTKQGGGVKVGAVKAFIRLAGWTKRRTTGCAASGSLATSGSADRLAVERNTSMTPNEGDVEVALAAAAVADSNVGDDAAAELSGPPPPPPPPPAGETRPAEALSQAASAGDASMGAAGSQDGHREDYNGAAVAGALRDLFPDSFMGLVPISNSDPVDALIYKWDRNMTILDAAVRDLKISEARLHAGGVTDVEAFVNGAPKAFARSETGVLRGAGAGTDSGAGVAGWCGSRRRGGGGRSEREAAKVRALRERIFKLRDQILELEVKIQDARLEALASPLGTAYFAIFDNAQDAQTLAQCQRVVPPQGPGHLLSFEAVPAPPPDDICWPALWSTGWWPQAVRRMAIILPMAIIFAIPIGAFQGALSNLDVALCSRNKEDNKLFVSWFCDKTGFWSRIVTSLITGVLPSILGLVWSSFCMPQLLYFCCSVSRRALSLSAQEREMQTWFFWYSVFNTFLGAVLGGGVFSQLGTYLADPRALLDRIGKALPSTANFFIQYVIARAVFTNVLRLLWPHAGAMLTSIFRSVLFLGRPRSLHASAWIHQVPSTRSTSYYIAILQVFMFGCAFAVVAPIILPCCWFFFFTGFFAYRYSILYVYERNYESGGRMWPIVFNQIMGFLLLMEIFGGAVFIVNKAYIFAIIIWFSLSPPLWLFWRHCRQAYLEPMHHPPLTMAAQEPAGVRVDPLVYTPPALRPGAIGWYPEQGKVWEKYGIPKHWW